MDKQINHERLKDLAATHVAEFSKRQRDRLPYEEDWLCLLRQSKGEYDPDTLSKMNKSVNEQNGSRAYPQWTRSKEIPLYAKLVRFILSEKYREVGRCPPQTVKKGFKNFTARFCASSMKPIWFRVRDPPYPTVEPSGIIFQTSAKASEALGKNRASKLYFFRATIVLSTWSSWYH